MKKPSKHRPKPSGLGRRMLVLITLASSALWAGIGLGLSAAIG